MPSRHSLASRAVALLAVAGCTAGGGGQPDDAVDGGTGGPADASIYEAPRDDLVPAVGGDATFDVATWNIENFPARASTPRLVADLIASLDLDLVAVQEIASVEAFEEVVARLPEHAGLLSSHTYGDGTFQKVGFVYREASVTLRGGALLFGDQGLDFPRPPLQVEVEVDGRVFTAITLHLKAGGEDADRARRIAAIARLEEHLRARVEAGVDQALVLGDFNQTRASERDDEVWAPIVDAPERYRVLTEAAADAGDASFVPSRRFIDHHVATAALDLGVPEVVVPHLEDAPIDYLDAISDHLPVVVRFAP